MIRVRGNALIVTMAVATGSMVLAQSRNGAHDLRDAFLRRIGDETATCVFCHTPRGTRIESAQPPRWQSNVEGAAEFGVYTVTSVEPGSFDGGASLLCMSCHDATQAPVVGTSPRDHPVGVRYAGVAGTESQLPALQVPRTIDVGRPAHDLRAPPRASSGVVANFRAPSRGLINERSVWWVATSPNSARRTRSDLPLYSNSDSSADVPTIECATCHDPHNNNAMFLRVENDGSRLCLSCHDI